MLAFAALALMQVIASAEVPLPPPFESREAAFDRPGGEMCFSTGLRVTVLTDRRQPVVSVTAVVDRGADADPAGKEGAAHLLEHLWFRARPTGQVPVGQVIDQLGAQHNAFTLADATVYTTVADVSALRPLLALEAARLTDPLAAIDAALVAQEAAIVRSELRLSGYNLADLTLLMPSDLHGVERPLRPSTPSSVMGITLDDLRGVAESYRPERTSILIRGDVTTADVRPILYQTFPEALRKSAPGPSERDCSAAARPANTPPPPRPAAPVHRVNVEIEQPVLLFGWSMPAAWSANDAMLRVGEVWLTEHLNVAFETAKLDDVYASCAVVGGATRSAMLCEVNVPNGVAVTKLQSLVDGALRAAPEAVLGPELADLAFRLRTRVALGIEALSPLYSDAALSDALANHFQGSPVWFLEVLDAFDRVDVPSFQAFLRGWASADRVRTALLIRESADFEGVMAGRFERAPLTVRKGAATELRSAPTEAEELVGHHAPLVAASVSVQPTPPRAPRPLVWALPSGLEVVFVPHGDVPLVQVGLFARGGPAGEPLLGMDAWTWEMTSVSKWGVPKSSYAFAAELLGAEIWTSRLLDGRAVTLAGNAAALDGQLWLLRNFAEGTYFYKDASYWHDQRLEAKRDAVHARSYPGVALTEARRTHLLGADHPLAAPYAVQVWNGSKAKYRELDRHVRSTWEPANTRLVIVGAVNPNEAIAEVDRWFGTWRPEKKLTPLPVPARSPTPLPSGRQAFTTADPERGLTAINLECRVEDAGEAVESVGAELLRESLWATLRESQVGAYDPSVGVWGLPGSRVLRLSANVPTQHVASAANALDRLVQDFAGAGPNPAAVDRVGARLAAGWSTNFVEVDALFWFALREGADLPKRMTDRPGELTAVRVADLQAWAAPCAAAPALSVLGPAPGALEGTVWGPHAVVVQPGRSGW